MMAIEAVGGLEPIVTFFNPLSSPGGVTHIDDFTQISDILQRWQTKDAGVILVKLGSIHNDGSGMTTDCEVCRTATVFWCYGKCIMPCNMHVFHAGEKL